MILIIAEKPKAARRIADALADGNIHTGYNNKIAFYEFERNGREITVAASVGHLYGLESAVKGWDYPVYETKWVPTYTTGAKYSRAYLETIVNLAQSADDVVNACDFDIEGSSIFYNILRFACKKQVARRMKFSTLTAPDIQKAYDNALPTLDMGFVNAGLARHQLDWLYGINLSRALTHSIKRTGRFSVLSTGRVQGPTLALLSERELEIRNFSPEPYFVLDALLDSKGVSFEANHEEKFTDKKKALSTFEACSGKSSKVTDVKTKTYKQDPPVPFDLTTLQTEASRHLHFTPKLTQEIAQSLYEAGLISYPRTSSQKLPKELGLEEIMKKIANQAAYSSLAQALLINPPLRPNEGKKNDPAHPAIHPTGIKPGNITAQGKKLYDLVVRRFLAVFGKAATRETVKVKIDIGGVEFVSIGRRTVDRQWMIYYGPYAKFEENELPALKARDILKLLELDLNAKDTQPPKRYTGASLLRAMEKMGIGTKATRANIIQTLESRGYISGKSFVVSDLGLAVTKTLGKYTPKIISPELTRDFEEKMDEIHKGEITKEKVVKAAKGVLSEVLSTFKEKELEIGKGLLGGLEKTRDDQSSVGKCPKCGSMLKVRMSRAKKRFIGCSGYPNCTNSYPLPQKGKLEVLSKKCPDCGMPMIRIISAGRRPWDLCIDMNCPSKAGYKKRYEAKKASAQMAEAKKLVDSKGMVKKTKASKTGAKKTATKKNSKPTQ